MKILKIKRKVFKMKVYLTVTSIFLLLLIPSLTNAYDKIDGAFGISLGTTFESSQSIGQSSLTDGTPMYQFSPTKQFRSFSRYYVLITPTTNKIYSIWGLGSIENTQKCEKERDLVMSLLEKKYGGSDKESFSASMTEIFGGKSVKQGERNILVKCSGFIDATIEIRYYDDNLRKIAEKERLEEEAEKVDSSGL